MERNIGKDEKDDLELFKGSLKDFDICGKKVGTKDLHSFTALKDFDICGNN